MLLKCIAEFLPAGYLLPPMPPYLPPTMPVAMRGKTVPAIDSYWNSVLPIFFPGTGHPCSSSTKVLEQCATYFFSWSPEQVLRDNYAAQDRKLDKCMGTRVKIYS